MDPLWSTCFDSPPFAWIPTNPCVIATFPSSTFVDQEIHNFHFCKACILGICNEQRNTLGSSFKFRIYSKSKCKQKEHLLYIVSLNVFVIFFFGGGGVRIVVPTWTVKLDPLGSLRASNFCGRLSLKIHCFVEKPPPWRECLRTRSLQRSSTIQPSDFSGEAPNFSWRPWKIWGTQQNAKSL